MEISVREFQTQVLEALAAAESGERVAITRDGRVVAELNAVPHSEAAASSDSIEAIRQRLNDARRAAGLDGTVLQSPLDEAWRQWFDDPALGRAAIGLPEDWAPFPR